MIENPEWRRRMADLDAVYKLRDGLVKLKSDMKMRKSTPDWMIRRINEMTYDYSRIIYAVSQYRDEVPQLLETL